MFSYGPEKIQGMADSPSRGFRAGCWLLSHSPALSTAAWTVVVPCDLPLPCLQSPCHQGGLRGPDSDADVGAPMGGLLHSLSFRGGRSLEHLLA